MSMGAPMMIGDPRASLVDALRENSFWFRLATLFFKNGKGVFAVSEISKLETELYAFARNPEIGIEDLGPKPKEPDVSKLSKEQQAEEIATYKEILRVWEMTRRALSMQVSVEDMLVIEQFMKPMWDAVFTSPAIKGKLLQALTKLVDQEEQQGLGGIFKKNRQ